MTNKRDLQKLFADVNSNASLKDMLSTFTKADLDDVRRTLEVIGASTLKKSNLIDVLDEKIKSAVPSIMNKLSGEEYKLLSTIVKNGGVLRFEEEYLEAVISLRKYGVVFGILKDKGDKFILVPQELSSELNILLKDSWDEVACAVMSPKVIIKGKIGRNEPCPCGSGRKYKRCCLN